MDNGYPRPTQEVGVASIKRDKIIEPIPVDTLGSNGGHERFNNYFYFAFILFFHIM